MKRYQVRCHEWGGDSDYSWTYCETLEEAQRVIDEFYEKIVKEGFLLGIGFGKAHMIRKILEFPLSKSEIFDMNLEEYIYGSDELIQMYHVKKEKKICNAVSKF